MLVVVVLLTTSTITLDLLHQVDQVVVEMVVQETLHLMELMLQATVLVAVDQVLTLMVEVPDLMVYVLLEGKQRLIKMFIMI